MDVKSDEVLSQDKSFFKFANSFLWIRDLAINLI